MYIKKINPYKLTDDDLDKKVTRVKVLIFTDDNKLLLCNVDGKYTYIGGHVEENEKLINALIRELSEETGICLNNLDEKPFLKIEKWNKNHFDTGKKCLSEIYYYSLHTNKEIEYEKMNLDKSEKLKNFFLRYIDIDEFYNYLDYHKNYLHSELHSEMLYVLNYYIKKMCRGKSDEKKYRKTL